MVISYTMSIDLTFFIEKITNFANEIKLNIIEIFEFKSKNII